MFISGSPQKQDYGTSHGASAPRTLPPGRGLDAPEEWGDGDASSPATVTVHVSKHFAGEGHAATLRRMYERATLFALLGNMLLALLALLMFCVAAVIVIFAPADRHALIPWIALPPSIISFGLGGFAMFRLSLAGNGLEVTGG